MKKPMEAMMKQLTVTRRQTLNEIVTATGPGKGEVVFALSSLASPDEGGGGYSSPPRR